MTHRHCRNNGGDGPNLYIDGSRYCNPKKSQCSVPWLVTPMPAPKPEEDVGPPKKKKKLSVEDAAAAEHDDKEKKKPVPTHTVEYEAIVVETVLQKYTYEIPYLVDNQVADFANIFSRKCFRGRTAFDDGEVVRKTKKDKESKQFLFT